MAFIVTTASLFNGLRRLLLFDKEANAKELRTIKKTIRKTMTVQKREVKGIGDIILTVGKAETNKFQAENDSHRERGESYYTRVKNDVGSKEQIVVVWIKLVSDHQEFITDLKLGSTHPKHDHFFFGDKEDYQVIVHPKMRGMGANDPSLCLWCKKDSSKPRHIADLKISYTRGAQVDLVRNNYEMLPLCLSRFGLAYANIWVLWTSSKVMRLTDSDHIEKELKDCEYGNLFDTILLLDVSNTFTSSIPLLCPFIDTAMLKTSPDDPVLIKMVNTANRRLRDAQLQEEDHGKDIPGDDLVYIKHFLALKSAELDKLCSIYRSSIDLDRDGRISIEDYTSFLSEPLTMAPFIRQIFVLSLPTDSQLGAAYSNSNAKPILEVGATLKATAIFCMLCSSELLKCIFAWHDTKGYGVINNSDFLHLLGIFHPRHNDDVVVRALKEVDIPEDGTMTFSTFEGLTKKLPYLMYSAFRVQEKMRQKFMGVRWWRRKLALYAKANKQLLHDERQTKEAETLEMKERYEFARELRIGDLDGFVVGEKKRQRRKTVRR